MPSFSKAVGLTHLVGAYSYTPLRLLLTVAEEDNGLAADELEDTFVLKNQHFRQFIKWTPTKGIVIFEWHPCPGEDIVLHAYDVLDIDG